MTSKRPATRSSHGAPRDSAGSRSKLGSLGSVGLDPVPSKRELVEAALEVEEVAAQMDSSQVGSLYPPPLILIVTFGRWLCRG